MGDYDYGYSYGYGKSTAPRLSSPKTWRRKHRRIFMLTSPVSVPVWAVVVIGRGFSRAAWRGTLPIRKLWK